MQINIINSISNEKAPDEWDINDFLKFINHSDVKLNKLDHMISKSNLEINIFYTFLASGKKFFNLTRRDFKDDESLYKTYERCKIQ